MTPQDRKRCIERLRGRYAEGSAAKYFGEIMTELDRFDCDGIGKKNYGARVYVWFSRAGINYMIPVPVSRELTLEQVWFNTKEYVVRLLNYSVMLDVAEAPEAFETAFLQFAAKDVGGELRPFCEIAASALATSGSSALALPPTRSA